MRLRALAVVVALVAAAPVALARGRLVAPIVPEAPAPDPPRLEGPAEPEPYAPPLRPLTARAGELLQEWTLHKTADGAHPDGLEQTYVWLMNRARQDPAAEGVFLAELDERDVQDAIRAFGVDVDLLLQEFAALEPKPPAAFDVRLYEAARAHSLDLIARRAQDHNGQFDRVKAAGFVYQKIRGNVFVHSGTSLYGHAAFNIDWGGNDGTGMQTGRGHRKAIMSIDGNYTNVGIAVVPDTSLGMPARRWAVTGNYAYASGVAADHYNRFVVGTVWQDLDADGLYDPGEGIGGVTVVPSRGPWFAVTAAGGGYALPVLSPGPLELEFSGGGVPTVRIATTVGDDSVLVDYETTRPRHRVPEPGAAAAGGAAALALAALGAHARRHRLE